MYKEYSMRRFITLAASLLLSTALTGCIVIGASSRHGFFFFPRGLGLVVLILIIIAISRNHNRY